MAMKKPDQAEVKAPPQVDSGVSAAVSRLQASVEKVAEKAQAAVKNVSYDQAKQDRILVQGTVQSVTESPFVAGMKIKSDPKEFAKNVLEIADLLIAGIRERAPM